MSFASVPSRSQARVQREVRERASRLGLKVGFGQGRRATDVTLVVVKGDRLDVLRGVPVLFEGLGLDEEMVRASQTPEGFELMVALLKPKSERKRIDDERRASELAEES